VNKSLTTSLFAKWRWAGINAFCDKLLNLMLYCWIREYFTTGHELTIHAKVVCWTAELTLYNICFANIRGGTPRTPSLNPPLMYVSFSVYNQINHSICLCNFKCQPF
jgi:hypothetical protein